MLLAQTKLPQKGCLSGFWWPLSADVTRPVFEVPKQAYQYPCSHRHTGRPKTLFKTTSPRSTSYQSWNTRFCFVRVSELCTLFIVMLRWRGLSFYRKLHGTCWCRCSPFSKFVGGRPLALRASVLRHRTLRECQCCHLCCLFLLREVARLLSFRERTKCDRLKR